MVEWKPMCLDLLFFHSFSSGLVVRSNHLPTFAPGVYFVWPLPVILPGMDECSTCDKPFHIPRWVIETCKPSHQVKIQSHHDTVTRSHTEQLMTASDMVQSQSVALIHSKSFLFYLAIQPITSSLIFP